MSVSRMRRRLVLGGLLLAAATAPAMAQGSHHGGQCFLSSNVANFNAPDDHTVYLRVGVNEIWKLGLMNNCLELSWRQTIGLQASPGPWICRPIQATILSRGAGIPHRCPVISMHRLTPDEVAALPKGVKP